MSKAVSGWYGIEELEVNMQTEDKHAFVNGLNELFIQCGAGRYDHLMSWPVHFMDEYDEGIPEGMQVMEYRGRKVDITCDSLTSIAREFVKLIG